MRVEKFLITVLASITVIVSAPYTEAAQKVESTPSDHKPTLDGDPADWDGMPVSYLKDSLHILSIAHDEENLYLMFRFADEQLARDIMRRGVTLWLNGDGKAKNKNEAFAVRYPGSKQISDHLDDGDGPKDGRRPDETSPSGSPNQPPELASLRQLPGQLTVIRMGIKEISEEKSPEGPGAASKFADESFCYEIRVPISEIGGKIAQSDPTRIRQLAMGIQIGGMTKAEREMAQSVIRQHQGDSGGMRGGMGGSGTGRPSGGGTGGGSMGGRPPGSGSGGRSQEERGQFDPEIHWLSLTLAPIS